MESLGIEINCSYSHLLQKGIRKHEKGGKEKGLDGSRGLKETQY
jgi:hypothetical protein